MSLTVLLFVLALLGLLDAGFLVWRHYKKQPLICPLNHDCSVVTESEWAELLGVRNDVLGVVYYCCMLGGTVAALMLRDYRTVIYQGLLIFSIIAALFSLMLLYVQKYILKEYCFYCIISCVINVVMVGVVVAMLSLI